MAEHLQQPAAGTGAGAGRMQLAGFDGRLRGGELPLRLGGQARAGPMGVGVRLEQGQVRHRQVRVQRPRAAQREFAPVAVVVLLPVDRTLQILATHPIPALGQPQRGVEIAAGGDERLVLAIGHQPRGQLERRHVLFMARQLVIEAEALAVVADRGQAAIKAQPGQRRRRRGQRRGRVQIRRQQGALRQQVLDVGEHQFLMLLLVLQPQRDQRLELAALARIELAGQQARHARVDVGPVGAHLRHRRPRQQAALGARMLFADAVVIGVEQHPERRMERLEAGLHALQDKGLEEPRGVRQVPFDRTGVGHRLRAAILVGQRLGQQQRMAADVAITGAELGKNRLSRQTHIHGRVSSC
jgi:hypothetical protein